MSHTSPEETKFLVKSRKRRVEKEYQLDGDIGQGLDAALREGWVRGLGTSRAGQRREGKGGQGLLDPEAD